MSKSRHTLYLDDELVEACKRRYGLDNTSKAVTICLREALTDEEIEDALEPMADNEDLYNEMLALRNDVDEIKERLKNLERGRKY